jgi:hypothetical protein
LYFQLFWQQFLCFAEDCITQKPPAVTPAAFDILRTTLAIRPKDDKRFADEVIATQRRSYEIPKLVSKRTCILPLMSYGITSTLI